MMTIGQAIAELDKVKPNNFEKDQKIRWLSRLDGQIASEIMSAFLVEIPNTDYRGEDAVLLVWHPFDDIYLYWMSAQIDFFNGETQNYENSMQMFNSVYQAFQRAFVREHKPKVRHHFRY